MLFAQRWLMLAVVSSALLLIVVDMTVLYTALPALTRDLQASATEKLWIINAYQLVAAGLLLPMGVLGDRYGHRRLFLAGLVVFGLASLLAAFSPSPAWLISARVCLAVGAAMMMPATLALIRTGFSDEQERTLAIGIWAAVSGGGMALGPVIGGVILEYFWWGAVFLVNVPVVVVALVMAVRYVPVSAPDWSRPFDLLASAQIMVGLIAAIMALKEACGGHPDYVLALSELTVAVVAILLFLRHQRAQQEPMIDFRLFRSAPFANGFVIALVTTSAIVGVELVTTQRLQLVLGFSPLQAGLYILPLPLSALVAGPLAGVLAPRIGNRRSVSAAMILSLMAALALALSISAPMWWQLLLLALLGLGIGFAMTVASTAMMFSVVPEKAGMAASLEEVSYELGAAFGIALLGSLMTAVYTSAFQLPAALTVPAAHAADSIDAALMVARGLPAGDAGLLIQAAGAAFDQAAQLVFWTAAVLVLVCLVWVLIADRRQSQVNSDQQPDQ